MSDEQPKKRSKAHRAAAIARRKLYYATRPAFTLANKKRTLSRQIRNFPEDSQARNTFVERYGNDALISILARATKRSKRRAKRKASKEKGLGVVA